MIFKVFETKEDCSTEELEKELNKISKKWTILSVILSRYSIYEIVAYKEKEYINHSTDISGIDI